jgi:DALR anticodon binding domain
MIIIALRAIIGKEPLLWPGGAPGTYVCRAPELAPLLVRESWIASAEVSSGFLNVTVTRDALAGVADEVTQAGDACTMSDILRGQVVPGPPVGRNAGTAQWVQAPDWAQARAALAAELTSRLAVAAGATVADSTVADSTAADSTAADSTVERASVDGAADGSRETGTGLGGGTTARSDELGGEVGSAGSGGAVGTVAAGVAYAGEDAVRFALARTVPGGAAPDPAAIARHLPDNPAYAVRYAHAVAAAVLRWAGSPTGEFRPGLLAEPGELAHAELAYADLAHADLALLDALSWLPERVAVAARRGRPDEFARYLETLASRTIDVMSTTSNRADERVLLAAAARTGLAAGLGLLGISAPERL